MTDTEIVLKGMLQVLYNFRFAVAYAVISLFILRRWERNEQKRLAAIIKRQNARKTYKSTSNI